MQYLGYNTDKLSIVIFDLASAILSENVGL